MSVIGSLELNVILEQVKKQCSFSLGIEYVDSIKPSFANVSNKGFKRYFIKRQKG